MGGCYNWDVVASWSIWCMEAHRLWNSDSASVSGSDFHAVQEATILRKREVQIRHHEDLSKKEINPYLHPCSDSTSLDMCMCMIAHLSSRTW